MVIKYNIYEVSKTKSRLIVISFLILTLPMLLMSYMTDIPFFLGFVWSVIYVVLLLPKSLERGTIDELDVKILDKYIEE